MENNSFHNFIIFMHNSPMSSLTLDDSW